MGWERGLGYPTTDETGTPDGVGKYNHFQTGSIYWTPGTGAHEVHGQIRDKWAAIGWERSPLGYPTSDELDDGGPGRYNLFQGGTIIWTGWTGAHELHGAIYKKYVAGSGLLGYPTSDETGTPDGIGRYNHFETGSIYWTPSTGAHEVRGSIRSLWASMGWERSCLGYPIADQNAYYSQDFQHGYIWSDQDGTFAHCD